MARGNGKEQLLVSEIIEELKRANGFMSVAARALATSVTTIAKYRDRYPEIQQVLNDIRESRKDFAENQLWTKVKDGDTTCILFFLKCQAKDRGYVERQEHKVEGGVKLESIIDALPKELAEQVCSALTESVSGRGNPETSSE